MKGWYRDNYRHSLAARGFTRRYAFGKLGEEVKRSFYTYTTTTEEENKKLRETVNKLREEVSKLDMEGYPYAVMSNNGKYITLEDQDKEQKRLMSEHGEERALSSRAVQLWQQELEKINRKIEMDMRLRDEENAEFGKKIRGIHTFYQDAPEIQDNNILSEDEWYRDNINVDYANMKIPNYILDDEKQSFLNMSKKGGTQ